LRGQLSLFASGDLDAAQHKAVDEHLKSCPTCRLGVQTFQKTRSLLGSYGQQIAGQPEIKPLLSSVMGRVNSKGARGRPHQPPHA
jgi:anti-sigma factor RsiW